MQKSELMALISPEGIDRKKVQLLPEFKQRVEFSSVISSDLVIIYNSTGKLIYNELINAWLADREDLGDFLIPEHYNAFPYYVVFVEELGGGITWLGPVLIQERELLEECVDVNSMEDDYDGLCNWLSDMFDSFLNPKTTDTP
ncbi:hypothetical protein ACFL6N_00445 [Thermodesulfobacteriota bacterium]